MDVSVTVEQCTTCGDRTPHSRPSRVPALLAAGLLLAGALLLALHAGMASPGALLPGAPALRIATGGRRRHLHVACERCRWKLVALDRAARPSLGRNTEIQLF